MITTSNFKPLWWLQNPHLQTLWPVFTRRTKFQGRPERLELPDGDFLDLVWTDGNGPLVIVLHGLEGSIHSHYASAMMKALQDKDFQAVFMHFRGCSHEPNRLPRSYHSGETGDLATVAEYATLITGKPVYAAIGYSLGGNVLLKWMGEQGKYTPVEHAIAISVPYVLSDAAKRMSKGLSKIYQTHLVKRLQKSYNEKFAQRHSPINPNIKTLNDFYHFDDQITAPLHGFSGADEYYRLSSSRQYLKSIQKNTLIIHSRDDPFMFPHTLPKENELSEYITLELAQKGGHVGFISGKILPQRWLEQRIMHYLLEPLHS